MEMSGLDILQVISDTQDRRGSGLRESFYSPQSDIRVADSYHEPPSSTRPSSVLTGAQRVPPR